MAVVKRGYRECAECFGLGRLHDDDGIAHACVPCGGTGRLKCPERRALHTGKVWANMQQQGYRACEKCDLTGTRDALYGGTLKPCFECEGRGYFAPLDEEQIRADVKGRGTPLRSAAPLKGRKVTVRERRAYYVWRMARFHGGADVCVPMVATWFCGDDAFGVELDILAESLAREAFGTDMAAAAIWGRALGAL